MQGSQQQEAAAWATLAGKIAPGVIGALIALRWVPTGATWLDRLASFAGGCGCAVWGAPAIAEWAGVTSLRIDSFVGFTVGLLGMVVVGEIVQTLRSLQLAEVIRNALKARLGGTK